MDLIDRQAVIKAICEDGTWLESQGCVEVTMAERKQRDVDIICSLPSAERHGKWLHKNSTFKNHWLCSECGYTWYFDTKEASYCPHCGATMRGE